MKGNDRIIELLNARLAEELTASNQYMVHAEMDENWKYGRLHEVVRRRAIQEMKHAEKIIERILFLDGQPVVSKLNEIHVGRDVQAQLAFDLKLELAANAAYNETARVASELGDAGTRELIAAILVEEEEHVDWLEAQLGQIEQVGIQNYLAAQIG